MEPLLTWTVRALGRTHLRIEAVRPEVRGRRRGDGEDRQSGSVYRRDAYQLIRTGLTGGKASLQPWPATPPSSPPSPHLASTRSTLDGRPRTASRSPAASIHQGNGPEDVVRVAGHSPVMSQITQRLISSRCFDIRATGSDDFVVTAPATHRGRGTFGAQRPRSEPGGSVLAAVVDEQEGTHPPPPAGMSTVGRAGAQRPVHGVEHGIPERLPGAEAWSPVGRDRDHSPVEQSGAVPRADLDRLGWTGPHSESGACGGGYGSAQRGSGPTDADVAGSDRPAP